MSLTDYAKSHPYQIAGGVFMTGLIVILYVRSKATSSAVAQPTIVSASDPGYNAATVQANTQLQAIQTAASAHAADTQAALQQDAQDNAAAIQIAQLALQATGQTDNTAENIVSMNNNSTIAQAQINAGVQGQQIAADAATAQLGITTTGAVQQDAYATQLGEVQSNNAATVAQVANVQQTIQMKNYGDYLNTQNEQTAQYALASQAIASGQPVNYSGAV